MLSNLAFFLRHTAIFSCWTVHSFIHLGRIAEKQGWMLNEATPPTELTKKKKEKKEKRRDERKKMKKIPNVHVGF